MVQQVEDKFFEWAKGKPLAASILPRFAMESIGQVRELLELRRCSQGPFAFEPAANEQLMLSFYRRKSLVRAVLDVLFGEGGRVCYRIYATLQSPNIGTDSERQQSLWLILLACMPTDLVDTKEQSTWWQNQNIDEAMLDEIMKTPVMQYVLRVAIPCWFVYGVLPDKLLWDAFDEDQTIAEKSISRLVRLDHRVVRHPIIREWVERENRKSPCRARKLRKWRQSKTVFDKPKSDSHWLKIIFGLLSSLSELYGHRLKAPDLRELAEVVECELPEDLAEYLRNRTTDDLSREIRRKRAHFALAPKPDRSEFEAVRALWRDSA